MKPRKTQSARNGYRRCYHEPVPQRGPDMSIPETRKDVLEKICARLDKDGSFLQQYSNGEFTSSSLAISRTFDGCRSVQVLECPGYTIHYDEVLDLYWRRGGSFD